jgi:hypothetical protein
LAYGILHPSVIKSPWLQICAVAYTNRAHCNIANAGNVEQSRLSAAALPHVKIIFS